MLKNPVPYLSLSWQADDGKTLCCHFSRADARLLHLSFPMRGTWQALLKAISTYVGPGGASSGTLNAE